MQVCPGDLVHTDADGVVVVAAELQAEVERNVADLAEIESAQEKAIRDRIPMEELQKILALKGKPTGPRTNEERQQ